MEKIGVDKLTAIRTRVQQRVDATVSSDESALGAWIGGDTGAPPGGVVIGTIGEGVEQPVAPWQIGAARVGHGSKSCEQLDNGRAQRLRLVRADLLEEPAMVAARNCERTAERVADREDLGHGQRLRCLSHRQLIGVEAVRRVTDS